MKRKIFVVVSLPSRTKKSLRLAIQKWEDLPIKWTKLENINLPLLELGFVDDDSSLEVCKKIRNLCQEEAPFDLEMEAIAPFPSAEKARRVILAGKPSEDLKNLVEKIEKELAIFSAPKKEYRPRIVLGRMRQKKWDVLENKPVLDKKFPLSIEVGSIDIIASNFENDDGEYATIESCPLNL